MKNRLNQRQHTILRSLCLKTNTGDQYLFDKFIEEKLDFNEIEKLCSIINNEFLMEGIMPNYEPNDYGLELEDLLDIVNSSRIK